MTSTTSYLCYKIQNIKYHYFVKKKTLYVAHIILFIVNFRTISLVIIRISYVYKLVDIYLFIYLFINRYKLYLYIDFVNI